MNILKIINLLFVYSVDQFWGKPNLNNIKIFGRRMTFVFRYFPEADRYFQVLKKDVFDDNPEASVEIMEKYFKKYKNSFVRYRMAYLYARTGNIVGAKIELSTINSGKARLFRKCLKKMTAAFTMTKTMLYTSKNYEVPVHYGEIESIIRKEKYKIGAEIGVFMGFHASHILEACRNVTLYCVDLYKNLAGNGYDNMDEKAFETLFVGVQRKLKPFWRASFIRMLSLEASKKFKAGSLDFVYIDADHRYEAVKNDIKNWFPKIKIGGLISGHDYDHPDWPGVKQAVDEWVNKNRKKVNIGKGGVWWTIK